MSADKSNLNELLFIGMNLTDVRSVERLLLPERLGIYVLSSSFFCFLLLLLMMCCCLKLDVVLYPANGITKPLLLVDNGIRFNS